MGGDVPPPFDTLKIGTSTETGSEISLSCLALKNFLDHVVYSMP